MIPNHMEQMERLPWTPNGKIDRSFIEENVSGEKIKHGITCEHKKEIFSMEALLEILKELHPRSILRPVIR